MKRTLGIAAIVAMTLLAGSVYAGGMGYGRGYGMGHGMVGWTSADASASACPGYGNAAYGGHGQGRHMAAWHGNQAPRGRQGMAGWMQAGPGNQGGMGSGMGRW